MRQLREFTDAVNEMENHGITHQTLRNKYHMTEWGARKFADIVSTGYKEIDGRGKKKYQRSESAPELDHETRHESIPVTNNYSQEVR